MVENQEPEYNSTFSIINRLLRFLWLFFWFILCRWTPNNFHGWRVFVLKIFGAKIGKNNFIYPNCKIWAPWLLTTGDYATIGPNVEVYNPGGIILMSHSIISQSAYLCGATHDYNTIDFTYIKKQIIIEPFAWICSRSIVLPGVTCKEGSVLGAGSVTSKDLEPWSVYTGSPAIKVKDRVDFLNNSNE